jgi:hypothetical protein
MDTSRAASPDASGARARLARYGTQPDAYVLLAGPYKVLMTTAQGALALDSTQATAALRASCTADHEGARAPLPAELLRPLTPVPDALVVVAGPSATGPRSGCEFFWNDSPDAVWRGLQFADPRDLAARAPRALRLVIDRDTLRGVESELAAYGFRAGRWERGAARLLHAFPMSSLAPRADGRPRALVLVVDGALGPVRVPLPDLSRPRARTPRRSRVACARPDSRSGSLARGSRSRTARAQPMPQWSRMPW